MKGVNKQVIEINEPDSETIERVLVVLRQKDGHVNVARARQEAERYVETLVCWRRGFLCCCGNFAKAGRSGRNTARKLL